MLNEVKATDTVPANQVFTAVEKAPQFPGDFGAFLGRNIRYPAVDKDNNVQGKVFIQFIVETDGSLDDFKVMRAPSETLGDESVRVLSTSPKWIPGYQNGKAVRVMYTVPISFTLSPPDDRKSKTLQAVEVVGYDKSDTTKQTLKIKNGINLTSPASEALIIIDGKEKTYEDMKLLDANKIESISVLKDESAKKIYGEKGKNGVIIVTTKK